LHRSLHRYPIGGALGIENRGCEAMSFNFGRQSDRQPLCHVRDNVYMLPGCAIGEIEDIDKLMAAIADPDTVS
jgi:hypothetical protein